VGISHSGRTKVTCEAMQLAADRGACTAGISNYMKSTLSKSVQYLLCTSFPEEKVKSAALSSRIAQLCIIDAIYLLTAKQKENVWDTEGLNKLIEKLLRIG
jgi:RpiR family carbohydrate utilization transcriptional regulator